MTGTNKHPAGGYAAVMYFDSSLEDQGWPEVRPDHHHQFGTFLEACRYAEQVRVDAGHGPIWCPITLLDPSPTPRSTK